MAELYGYAAIRAAEIVEAGLRQTRSTKCVRCGAEVLIGDDDDKCAFRATVDIEPIDHLAEVLAILAGLHTYNILPARDKGLKPGSFKLYSRFCQYSNRDNPVLIQHVCNRRRA